MNRASGKMPHIRWLAIFMPVAISLPMAWISLAKLSLVLTGLFVLVQFRKQGQNIFRRHANRVTLLILLAVVWFGISMSWTIAPLSHAGYIWLKHAKLLIIPLLLLVLHSRELARLAMQSLIAAQGAVILLSWLLYLGIPIPSFAENPGVGPVVFSTSYIDQSAMFVIASGLAWHLRDQLLWPKWIGYVVPALGLANVLFLLPGRTGYVAVFVLVGLASWYALPQRVRWITAIAVPLCLLVIGLFTSGQIRSGIGRIVQESTQFVEASKADTNSSSGWRLNAWHRSLQAIAARPIQGYGIGSFVPAVKAFELDSGDAVFGTGLSSNPHEEFLLWGVELGIGGSLLLVAILVSICMAVPKQNAAAKRSIVSVVAVVVVACLFNSALFDDLIGDFLCFSLGICLALGANVVPEHSSPKHA